MQAKCMCGRKLAHVPAMRYATDVYTRTCRKCGAKWRLVVRPLMSDDSMMVHQVDMTCLKGVD